MDFGYGATLFVNTTNLSSAVHATRLHLNLAKLFNNGFIILT